MKVRTSEILSRLISCPWLRTGYLVQVSFFLVAALWINVCSAEKSWIELNQEHEDQLACLSCIRGECAGPDQPYCAFRNCTDFAQDFHKSCIETGLDCRTLHIVCDAVPGHGPSAHAASAVNTPLYGWCGVEPSVLPENDRFSIGGCTPDVPASGPSESAFACEIMGRKPEPGCGCRITKVFSEPQPGNTTPKVCTGSSEEECDTCCSKWWWQESCVKNNIAGASDWHKECVKDCKEGKRANSHGDPHLTTFDGLAYDFQTVGEFIAVKDDKGFVLQVRQEPWPSSDSLSVNTGVAGRVGKQRFSIQTNQSPELYIEGEPFSKDLYVFQDGGQVTREGNTYEVRWTTGERIEVQIQGFYLDLHVKLPDNHKPIKGLFGDGDGSISNDLTGRDGDRLYTSVVSDEELKAFATSWRVKQEESLFDYKTGETTGTYTILGFPGGPAPNIEDFDPHSVDIALNQCRDADVLPGNLENCVTDVLATDGLIDPSSAADVVEPVREVEVVNTEGGSSNESAASTESFESFEDHERYWENW